MFLYDMHICLLHLSDQLVVAAVLKVTILAVCLFQGLVLLESFPS